MNRKTTPILLAIALVMGLAAFLLERQSVPKRAKSASTGARVLQMDEADIVQIRVKRDYWNSFAIARSPEGAWSLTEPSSEPASPLAVGRLLSALMSLPAQSAIDLPSDDSERYREYGLWEPSVEVTVSDRKGATTLSFGAPTPDGKGVYCAIHGVNKVYVTAPDAVKAISEDLSAYRQEASAK